MILRAPIRPAAPVCDRGARALVTSLMPIAPQSAIGRLGDKANDETLEPKGSGRGVIGQPFARTSSTRKRR
jgi:hypothetical protein